VFVTLGNRRRRREQRSVSSSARPDARPDGVSVSKSDKPDDDEGIGEGDNARTCRARTVRARDTARITLPPRAARPPKSLQTTTCVRVRVRVTREQIRFHARAYTHTSLVGLRAASNSIIRRAAAATAAATPHGQRRVTSCVTFKATRGGNTCETVPPHARTGRDHGGPANVTFRICPRFPLSRAR